MRLLFKSATKTFPLPSTATPRGVLNPPFPPPLPPQVVRNVPLLSNFQIRSPLVSAMKTLPLTSTARARGEWNCPPHTVKNVPHARVVDVVVVVAEVVEVVGHWEIAPL